MLQLENQESLPPTPLRGHPCADQPPSAPVRSCRPRAPLVRWSTSWAARWSHPRLGVESNNTQRLRSPGSIRGGGRQGARTKTLCAPPADSKQRKELDTNSRCGSDAAQLAFHSPAPQQIPPSFLRGGFSQTNLNPDPVPFPPGSVCNRGLSLMLLGAGAACRADFDELPNA